MKNSQTKTRTFYIGPGLRKEWDHFENEAKKNKIPLKDYILYALRHYEAQTLASQLKTRKVPMALAYREYLRGRNQGMVIEYLHSHWRADQVELLDVPWLQQWCADHPADANDILLFMASTPYAQPFQQWWQQISPPPAAHHTPTGYTALGGP